MRQLVSILILIAVLVGPVQAGEAVTLRHNLSGWPLDVLDALVLRFNGEQKDQSRVVLQGLSGIDEQQRKHLPHMALLDTDDSMAFFQTRPRFKPLYQVMAASGERLDAKLFFPLIADAVDDKSGRLLALPLGLSLPVLMWNKDAYRKAGLDPDLPPKTWEEVQARAGSLYDAGAKCPLTSSRFAWIHLENLSSQHGEPLAVHERNGRSRVVLNRLVDVKHLALLASWHKSSYFQYFGPGNEADRKFISGECGMFTGESSLYVAAARADFDVGVAEMPYYADMYGITPEKVLPDGAALWVLAGRKREEYQVIARFAGFMQRTDVQMEWIHSTGYLPMTPSVVTALKEEGIAPRLLDAAARRLSGKTPLTMRTKRGAGLGRLREILGEEIAAVWANTKPAKEALDNAMRRANSPGLTGLAGAASSILLESGDQITGR